MWVPKVLMQGQFECGSRPSVATVQDEILMVNGDGVL